MSILRERINEYSHGARPFQPMTLTIPSKDTIVALRELHPLLSNLIPKPIFDYQLEHIFVLDKTLFT